MAAPRHPIVWGPEAAADLSDIWDYYAKVAGPPVANDIVARIREACRLLGDHPLAGRARDEIRPGLRCAIATPHIVFYRFIDESAEIVRIVDGRRDLDDIFADDPKRP